VTQLYEIVAFGVAPVSLSDMKDYLKVTGTAQDALIQSMITAATEWGEKYTGREFRANQWKLSIDCFEPRIEVRKSPVATIDEVAHFVSGVPVVVDSSVYYLKKGNFSSETLLSDGQDWPVDTDEREQAITIDFTTEQYKCGDLIEAGIKQHVAHWFYNRGDCSCDSAANDSGVKSIYSLFKLQRT